MSGPSFQLYQDNPADLRKKCLQYRKTVSNSEKSKIFEKIILKLDNFLPFQKSEHILMYFGKTSSGEFDTTPLLKKILKEKELYLPKSIEFNKSLKLYKIDSLKDDIQVGLYNIKEPVSDRCIEVSLDDIQLIIVPGSVFDHTGGRYGYGAGYYDGLLSNFKGITIAFSIDALVMDFELKLHPRDVKLNFIISEKKIYS